MITPGKVSKQGFNNDPPTTPKPELYPTAQRVGPNVAQPPPPIGGTTFGMPLASTDIAARLADAQRAGYAAGFREALRRARIAIDCTPSTGLSAMSFRDRANARVLALESEAEVHGL